MQLKRKMFSLLPIKGQNFLFQPASSSVSLLRRVACDVRGGNREFACRLHSKCSLLHSRFSGMSRNAPKKRLRRRLYLDSKSSTVANFKIFLDTICASNYGSLLRKFCIFIYFIVIFLCDCSA